MPSVDTAAVSTLIEKADIVTPMTIRAGVRTGLFDTLVDGPRDADGIAAALGGDRRAVQVTVDHLVHEDLLAVDDGLYALTPLGRLLTAENQQLGVRDLFDTSTLVGRNEISLTDFHYTVLTGRPASEARSGLTLWQEIDGARAGDDAQDGIDAFEWDEPGFAAELILRSDVWQTATNVVDLGGNTGSLLLALLRRHAHLHGTVLDFPVFVERAVHRATQRGLGDRLRGEGGSFFDPLPTGFDVYLLSAVLADWNDDDAITILRRAAEAAGPHGRVVVAEVHLIAGDNLAPATSVAVRIEGSVTRPDRSPADVASLIERAGLKIVDDDTSADDRSLFVAAVPS
ncbi:MAG: methyltransferase [Rhodococcus sp. (in: high G+C Gram-positive bacteria)]